MSTSRVDPFAVPPRPPALPGFAGVSRFYDPLMSRWTAQVMPGECYVTAHDEVVQTVLGSCVSVCARDPVTGVGGLNHYMLPGLGTPASSSALLRFGVPALERLLETLREHGAQLGRLELKLFGGARVIGSPGGALTDIGRLNIDFIRRALEDRGLAAVAQSLGGTCARRLRYTPRTGQAEVASLEMATDFSQPAGL